MSELSPYNTSLNFYKRFVTREVSVGVLKMGCSNPIRIQSMTTTDTMNTKATVDECIRLIHAGCELIRITAPSINEAQNLLNIKNELKKSGHNIPICADIHFTPNAAECAARVVEKVRINPGNFVDKKKFEHIEYTNSEYIEEIDRIREKFVPLIKICKEYGTALRIGTNHGSLSDRILSRYGDTPLGMVESAMEFIKICEEENYYNIVLSMKASNPLVMIQAYRLLVATMIKNQQNYPLHLGVTEAGDGEDGRIKSAIGIGALLEDGLGDTIRVSLTEPPELEIPVAKKLVEKYNKHISTIQQTEPSSEFNIQNLPYNPYEYNRTHTLKVKNIGLNNVPIVIGNLSLKQNVNPANLFAFGYQYAVSSDKWTLSDMAADYIYIGNNTSITFQLPGNIGIIQNAEEWLKEKKKQHYPLFNIHNYSQIQLHPDINFLLLTDLYANIDFQISQYNTVIILELNETFYNAGEARKYILKKLFQYKAPIILKYNANNQDEETFILDASKTLGALMCDGIGDGIFLENNYLSNIKLNTTAFNILQAIRSRITKTEYIACPSCGRTLFDLQETTQKIREKTHHLKGVKIGIMGCIVNGPGEMADADFGYVGTGNGKISLYKGKEIIKRNIPEANAVEELINLIKENGMWKDK